MIYIITFILIILLFFFLYYRNKNKKNRKKYISALINSINQYIEKNNNNSNNNSKIKEQSLKKNIINDMGNIIAYPCQNYLHDINNTDYTLQVDNNLEQHYYKII